MRAYSLLEVKSFDEDERILEGLATTPKTDRDGDIVDPHGAVFDLPMPLLWQHKRDQPIGHVTHAEVRPEGIWIRAKVAKLTEPSPLKDLVDTAWAAIKAKLVRGFSVGMKPLERPEPLPTGGVRYRRWGWYETSTVTLPSNSGATIALVKSFDDEILAKDPAATSSARPRPGAPVKLISPKPQEGTVKIQEQIKAYEATRQAKVAEMAAIMEKSAETGETLDAEQAEKHDALKLEVKSIDEHLVRLHDHEKLNIEKAAPVPATPPAPGEKKPPLIVVKGQQELPPGVRFARVVKAISWAHRKHRDVEVVAREMFPDDALVQKAAVAAGTTVTGNWAAPLVSEEGAVFADFVEFLRPQTILGKFGTGGVPALRPTDFHAPLVTQTAGGDGYWVGEGKAKPLTKFGFSRRVLLPLKVANIAVLSEENIRYSSPKSDIVVRDSLAAALRERLDIDFINPDKGPVEGVSPASILYGVDPIPSSGTDADAVRADIGAMLTAFIAANNPPSSAVIIMPATVALALMLMRNALGQREFPDITMAGGFLEGMPVITSENVTSDDYGAIVAIVNASDIYIADDGGIAIDTSREASLEMDDAPSHNSGTPTPAQLVSMFQTNSVAIRAERVINWARRRDTAVQWLSDVAWSSAGA